MAKGKDNGHEAPPAGFVPAARWRVVTAGEGDIPALEGAEGAEPLWADIRCNLSGREYAEMLRTGTYGELWRKLAPHVRAWNVVGDEVETDAEGNETWHRRVLPAPAVAGPDVFALLDPQIVDWLAERVRNARFERADRPNSSRPPGGGAEGQPSESGAVSTLTSAA